MNFNNQFYPVTGSATIICGSLGTAFGGSSFPTNGRPAHLGLNTIYGDTVPPQNRNGFFKTADGEESTVVCAISANPNRAHNLSQTGALRTALGLHLGPPGMDGTLPAGANFSGTLFGFSMNIDDANNPAYQADFERIPDVLAAFHTFPAPSLGALIGGSGSVRLAKEDGTISSFSVDLGAFSRSQLVNGMRAAMTAGNQLELKGPIAEQVSANNVHFVYDVKYSHGAPTSITQTVQFYVRSGTSNAYTIEQIDVLKRQQIQNINNAVASAKDKTARMAKGDKLSVPDKMNLMRTTDYDRGLFTEAENKEIAAHLAAITDATSHLGYASSANIDDLYAAYAIEAGAGALSKPEWLESVHGPKVDAARESGSWMDIIKSGGSWLGDLATSAVENADKLGDLVVKGTGSYVATKANPNLVVLGAVAVGTVLLLR